MRYQRLAWVAAIATLSTVLQPSLPSPLAAQEASPPDTEIQQLRQEVQLLRTKVSNLESEIDSLRSQTGDFNNQNENALGMVTFLTGTFCALWAQNTRRNPWLWFFAGVFFNFITLLVLLNKNSSSQSE